MDPITSAIVAALSLGVLDGVREVGKEIIVDAYTALRNALKEKFGAESDIMDAVEKLEKRPSSASRIELVEEEVMAVRAIDDVQLQHLAQVLLEALKSTPEGEKTLGKYKIDVSGGQVGIIGDGTVVKGGIHLERPSSEK